MALRKMSPAFLRRADDDKAFERLYERHVGNVYRYAVAMLGDQADAEDVTQTTFMNAYRAFKQGTRPEKPQSWLIAIAHNVCRQRFRQAQRRPREVAFDERLGDGEPFEPIDAPSAEDLRRALSQLPANQRAAVVMRELEGCSYAEIAEVLGISVSALETLLFRARRALREQLDEQLTCQEAALSINKQLDGRLSFGGRRALRAHLRACPECNSLAQSQRAQRRALKTLVLIPLPVTMAHWFGNQTATAATGAAGAAGAGGLAAVGAGAGAGTGASSALLGGVAAKVAAVAAVGIVAGGTYEGVTHVTKPRARASQAAVARTHAARDVARAVPIVETARFAPRPAALPERASARAKARSSRSATVKDKRAAAKTPPGQAVKAIARTQPHSLRTLRPGQAVAAVHKTAAQVHKAAVQTHKATAQRHKAAAQTHKTTAQTRRTTRAAHTAATSKPTTRPTPSRKRSVKPAHAQSSNAKKSSKPCGTPWTPPCPDGSSPSSP
jgi:RNA polymerase sigma factor (sigma-70 family)